MRQSNINNGRRLALTILLLSPLGLVRAQTPAPLAPASLILPDATRLALRVNPTALAAAQAVIQAEARLAQAQAGRRFQISLNTTVSGSTANVIQPPPSYETFGTLQNTLTVPLPVTPRARLATAQAQAQLDAARAQLDSARLGLTAQVAAAYYDVLRKASLRQVADETLAQAARQLRDTQKRNRAGDVPALDVLRAQAPVASAQAQQAQAQTDEAIARQTLAALTGQDLDAPLPVADAAGDIPSPPYTLAQARALAVQRSPDVRAAQASARAAEAAVNLARLSRAPDVFLQAIDIRSTDQTSFSRVDTVQASVTLPLSDGGLAKAQAREAASALTQARLQIEAARRVAVAAVSAAYLTAQSARGQVASAGIAQSVAAISYSKTVQGYESGLFPFSDVLNAQTALTQARIAYAQAVYSAAVAASGLSSAVGGGPGLAGAPVPSLPPATSAPAAPSSASPAGTGAPGTTPAGNSATGQGTAPAAPGGRGTP